MFRKVDDDIIQQLQDIVGESHVIVERELMEPYSHDENPEISAWPEVVVRPILTEEVSAILELADRLRIPVTPRGGGQGLSGGSVPLSGGIVLSIERMNRILEIDHKNLMVTVEPGVITGDLHRAVEAEGLLYPPDPASQDSCFIGGNVAEGAGGPRAVKYGTTKDYVSALTVVLPGGEVVELGGKLVKDVMGYNLIQLMVGSEGTLGITTRITLRLVPLPKAQVDLLVPYDDFQKAADTVSDIIARSLIPAAIEFMEKGAVAASEKMLSKEIPFHDAEAQLLIQLTANREEELEAMLDEVGELCLEHGALDVLVAQDRPTRERLWEARRVVLEAMKFLSPINHTEDVSVPRSEIPTLLRGIHEITAPLAFEAVCFGHAGDGNVHVNFLKRDAPDEVWTRELGRAQKQLYDLALSLGGTITGEHGVGAIRKEFMKEAMGDTAIRLMKGIKKAFDPNGILNPGKVLD